MGKIVQLEKNPIDCLNCEGREVIHVHSEGRYYQRCRFRKEGYKSEIAFKSEDLKPGFISEKCPLQNEEDKIIKIIKEILGQMNVDKLGINVLNGGSEEYEQRYKYEIGENYGLKTAINIIKSYYPEIDINIEEIIRGESKI